MNTYVNFNYRTHEIGEIQFGNELDDVMQNRCKARGDGWVTLCLEEYDWRDKTDEIGLLELKRLCWDKFLIKRGVVDSNYKTKNYLDMVSRNKEIIERKPQYDKFYGFELPMKEIYNQLKSLKSLISGIGIDISEFGYHDISAKIKESESEKYDILTRAYQCFLSAVEDLSGIKGTMSANELNDKGEYRYQIVDTKRAD